MLLSEFRCQYENSLPFSVLSSHASTILFREPKTED